MKKGKRYDTSDLIETQFEPGSRGCVLKNLLGIKSKREMDQLEGQEQFRALDKFVDMYDRNHRFTAKDVCNIHKVWLGRIYAWAGQYRQVNISKGDFRFASANQISHLIEEFEKGVLYQHTACCFANVDDVVRALAIVHTELVLIHPFREGNGRAARLLAILMGLQAGLPPLDFGSVKGQKREEYFLAVRAGLDRNYEPMKRVFESVVKRTLRLSKKSVSS